MSQASFRRGAVVLSALVTACAAPPPSAELLSEPITATLHAPNTDFGKFRTFYLRPEIRNLTDENSTATLDAATAKPILDAVNKNMTSRGYKVADNPKDADLQMETLYVNSVSNNIYCYSWYDPYYWGYPAYGYYPYYGGCDGTVWRSGLLATLMVDATSARGTTRVELISDAGLTIDAASPTTPAKQLPGIWFSGVYGIELSSQTAVDGINESFAQSPYIAARSAGGSQ
jgi:Domain of unknown function (DUF4136)